MKNQIPGHVRAYTWILVVVGGVIAWLTAHNVFAIIGVGLVVLGVFLGDQATHMRQHHHEGDAAPPTWLEKKMWHHAGFFQYVGVVIFVSGLLVFAYFASQSAFKQGIEYGWKDGFNFGYKQGFTHGR